MVAEQLAAHDFETFVKEVGPRLQQCLTAMFGSLVGTEAAADALSYGWEHWDRVSEMENPGGYLFAVAKGRVRRERGRRLVLLDRVDAQRSPWVEPGLPGALERLSPKQRTVVMLVHCFGWSLAEVAGVLGVAKGTVQAHERRAMSRLRRELGVDR
jgi:DNA-directed RNA polymerase specialized sigma24 family protein